MKAASGLLGVLFAALSASACGGDERPVKEVPSPDLVRTLYGLNAGSCYRYRFAENGGNVFATVRLTSNTTAVAGKTTYVRSYQRANGGLPTEDYFDTSTPGEVRLLRHVEGPVDARETRRYEDAASAPLFARFAFDRAHQPVLDGERFETVTSPKGLPEERHTWNVLSATEMASTPDGVKTGYKLQYVRGTSAAISTLVPGFGIASFADFSGVTHQVCAARVCDDQGVCSGAESCDVLECAS